MSSPVTTRTRRVEVPTPGSTTKGRAKVFTVGEILQRPTEVMAEIEDLIASLGDDEVLVFEAPSCPHPLGGGLSSMGLELVVDEVADGVRSGVFQRSRSDELTLPTERLGG
jgi:hypothetical protein